MLRLLGRRAAVQLPLLAAVLAVVVIGATLLGVCALLLTTSQERGLDEGVSRATAAGVDVTAYVSGVPAADAAAVAQDARAVVTGSLAPFRTTVTTRASSVMRRLDGQVNAPRRLAYLSGLDDLPGRARLTAGRWPRAGAGSGRLETAVLGSTADALRLSPGSRVRLNAEVYSSDRAVTVTVEVVGVFRPLPDAGWDRDTLGAAGYDPAFSIGGASPPGPAYGPFMVDLADLFSSGSTIDRLQVDAHPDVSAPTSAALARVGTSLSTADARLAAVIGDRADIHRVASQLPVTLALAHAQQDVTRSTVLVVVLLGTALTAVALGLAGRLIAAVRATETTLLSRLGASPGQLVVAATVEAALLGALTAVLAVPLSTLLHAGLTHLPLLADAGLATRPQVNGVQVGAVVIGAMVLAAVLVVPSLRPDPGSAVATRGRLGLLTRSGADVLLVALAVVGWSQLRAQPATETGPDAVRVLAPALCLFAGAAVSLRLLAPPLRAAEWLARRSRGLVLPLAAFDAARRPRAVAAGLLLAMAGAAAAFGLAFGATWEQSQQDQADLRVGTDLALDLTSAAVAGQASAVAAVTGGAVSPVTDRGVAVGQWLGGAGNPPWLVAVDTTRAGELLRGRLPGDTDWARVGSALAPGTDPPGVVLRGGARPGLTLAGTSSVGPALQVVPRLVLQDEQGLRSLCDAPAVPLDGRAHRLRLCRVPAEGLSLVAVSLQIRFDPAEPLTGTITGRTAVTVSLRVPSASGAVAATAASWPTVAVIGQLPDALTRLESRVSPAAAGTVLRVSAAAGLEQLLNEPSQLVTTAFPVPDSVPVAVSRSLAGALGARPGTRLTVTVGITPVPVVVTRLLPAVPSAPDRAAMLADVDVLSRALIGRGDLSLPVDALWVGRPDRPAAGAAVTGLGLGEVVTRSDVAGELSGGPLRVGLPAALFLLVPAAVLLVLAGTLMHVTSDVEARALEVARLRGLGLPRRSIRAGLLAQHGGVLVLLVAAGAAVGALTSRAVSPLLIRSDLGAAPVPSARNHWPWLTESALLAVLLVGGLLAVTVVVSIQLRRADAAHLRAGA